MTADRDPGEVRYTIERRNWGWAVYDHVRDCWASIATTHAGAVWEAQRLTGLERMAGRAEREEEQGHVAQTRLAI